MRRPAIVLLLVAALLIAPSLVTGVLLTHSSAHNLLWAGQFAEQFRAGVLYPRWMPDSFDGLGGPAFYFYPPLTFWLDALASLVAFDLPVPYRLGLLSLAVLWCSGLAMHAWLRTVTGRPLVALIGAIAYMAAPYHLLDHYMRGALAEFTAYAVLPLVLLSVARAAGPMLALSYAALLLAHLPTALLASVTILPAYAVFRATRLETGREARDFLWTRALGALLGVGLAALYLAPALSLQKWISSDQLWKWDYRPEIWFLLRPDHWADPEIMRLLAAISLSILLMCAGLAVVLLSPASRGRRAELAFWTASTVVVLALMAGLVPWFWQLPELAKVQFPWRMMALAELCIVTAVCAAPWPQVPRPARLMLVAGVASLAPAAMMIVEDAAIRIDHSLKVEMLPRRDVKEYEPRGYPQSVEQIHSDLGLEPLKDMPLIECTPLPARCNASPGRFGTVRVELDSDRPMRVVLRRFYFPAWHLDPALPIAATEPLRLVSFEVPAGQYSGRLDRVTLLPEWIGLSLSASTGLLLLAWLRHTRRG